MRPPPTLTTGVTTAAALVLLTACGGNPGAPAASASSAAAASSASATASAGDGVEAFCTESGSVFQDLNAAFDEVRDPTQLPGLLQQATTALQSIDPPAEIEDSWTTFSGALAQLSQSAQGLDLRTTAGQDQFTQQYDALMAQTTAAQDDVDQYVTAHCPGAAGSSPTG